MNDIRKARFKATLRAANALLVIWSIPMIIIIAGIVLAGSLPYRIALDVHLLGAAGLLISLGVLARICERSWVAFGLAPLLLPILGPLISYFTIRRIGRARGWL